MNYHFFFFSPNTHYIAVERFKIEAVNRKYTLFNQLFFCLSIIFALWVNELGF